MYPSPLGADAGAKILSLFLTIVLVNTAWLAFGSVFSRDLNQPKVGRATNFVFAGMLVASVLLALLST